MVATDFYRCLFIRQGIEFKYKFVDLILILIDE